ncbi:19993_t:CDS:2 [Racocetra persica]|uniref:19993_t:CDS:1 n=1 Tax=Racocetra persica TaxID=160502 RepID=A0ACA9LBB7_9GLOM|nr:19993_t:CDS:2 [Racocetra persica]
MRGFEKLEDCIYDYLQSIENWSLQDIMNETISIEVFEFAYLDNEYKMTIYVSPNYHGQVAFSDVCVEMDESEHNDYLTDNGLCYAKKCAYKINNNNVVFKLSTFSDSSYSSDFFIKTKSETRTCTSSLNITL